MTKEFCAHVWELISVIAGGNGISRVYVCKECGIELIRQEERSYHRK